MIGGAIAAVAMLTAGAVAIARAKSSGAASALPSSSCGQCSTRGRGRRSSSRLDLPLQGAGRAQLLAMQQAIQFVLEKQYKFKAGKYTVGYQGCDDSTAQTGALGLGEVLVERPGLCVREERDRRARHVQLGLRQARGADPQPGAGRPGRDAQLGEHERRPDAQRAVEQPG